MSCPCPVLQLSDISRLRPLKDMISVTMSANPLSDLAHYRLYAVFHLRSLGVLDGQRIMEQERIQAEERFAQGHGLFSCIPNRGMKICCFYVDKHNCY